MRHVLLLSLLSILASVAFSERANAQSYPPVQPDLWRGPRASACAQFDRSKAQTCNFNPGVIGTRDSEDCRHYRENGNGTVTILCPEDRPDYYWMIRVASVARTCGENGIGCIGAYFRREGGGCTYRVIPDYRARGTYDVYAAELPSEWRVLIFRAGEGSHRAYEHQHRDQERFEFANLRNPYRQADPCRYSGD